MNPYIEPFLWETRNSKRGWFARSSETILTCRVVNVGTEFSCRLHAAQCLDRKDWNIGQNLVYRYILWPEIFPFIGDWCFYMELKPRRPSTCTLVRLTADRITNAYIIPSPYIRADWPAACLYVCNALRTWELIHKKIPHSEASHLYAYKRQGREHPQHIRNSVHGMIPTY